MVPFHFRGQRQGNENGGFYPRPVRDGDETFSQIDSILQGVMLPVGVRPRLNEHLRSAADEVVSLQDRLADCVRELDQRDQELRKLTQGTKHGYTLHGLSKENAALQKRIFAMSKASDQNRTPAASDRELQPYSEKLQFSKRKVKLQRDELHDQKVNIKNLSRVNADMRDRVDSLHQRNHEQRREISHLKGIVNDRGDGSLVALFESGAKLFKEQGQRIEELSARTDEAERGKINAVAAIEAGSAEKLEEKANALAVLTAELQEMEKVIADFKVMSKPYAVPMFSRVPTGAAGDLNPQDFSNVIPDIDNTLLFVQRLKRDIGDRERAITNLNARATTTQAKHAETISSTGTALVELQKKFDVLKGQHEELAGLMADSQKLVSKLNDENSNLLWELGRKTRSE